jgi:hypothetical protein
LTISAQRSSKKPIQNYPIASKTSKILGIWLKIPEKSQFLDHRQLMMRDSATQKTYPEVENLQNQYTKNILAEIELLRLS